MSGYEHSSESYIGQMIPFENEISPEDVQFMFHPVTGKKVLLLGNDLYARRIDPDNNKYGAVVYGAKPIPYRSRCSLEVEIAEYDNWKWFGSVRIGVMRLPTGTELMESAVPRQSEESDGYCMWKGHEVVNRLGGNSIKSEYGSVDLDDLGLGM